MAADQSTLVDVVTKSIEFRQTVVTVLLGVVGFILGKTWRNNTGALDRSVFRRLSASIVLAAASLVVMFYEQRRLLQAVSRDAIPNFAILRVTRREYLRSLIIKRMVIKQSCLRL